MIMVMFTSYALVYLIRAEVCDIDMTLATTAVSIMFSVDDGFLGCALFRLYRNAIDKAFVNIKTGWTDTP